MALSRHVSLFGVFSLASGAMISSGIFILPSLAFTQSGPAAALAYLLAGFLALLGVLSIIELSTAMPKAGGDYYYINRTLGPLFGTLSGFLGWLALSLKSAFAIFGISEIIYLLFGVPLLASAAGLTLLFVLINSFGVKEAIRFQTILVSALLLLMVAYAAFGLPRIDPRRFEPFLTGGVNNILITTGFIFISFGGLLNIATIAEEVKDPKKNIPRGMIGSVVVVTILYALTVVVTTGVLAPDAFGSSFTPIADAAGILVGPAGFTAITIASLLAFITTANAGILSASRYPLALSRDNLLPGPIARTSRRFGTPVPAIILTGIVIYLSLLLPLELLVKAASTVILTSYVLTNIAVIILRESGLSTYRPSFKTPFYPYLQLFGIGVFTFFIIDLGKESIEISLGFIFLSLCVYLFYGKRHAKGEFALLHLLKRVTDSRLKDGSFEQELREILISRDEIRQDEFALLAGSAPVFDIEGSKDARSLFSQLSGELARMAGISETEAIALYTKRQREYDTALSPYVAIPHIITGEESPMSLVIVRAREGIYFSEEAPQVKAIFFLSGPLSQRDRHLNILASIARSVSSDSFERMWEAAETPEEIRNLFILTSR